MVCSGYVILGNQFGVHAVSTMLCDILEYVTMVTSVCLFWSKNG